MSSSSSSTSTDVANSSGSDNGDDSASTQSNRSSSSDSVSFISSTCSITDRIRETGGDCGDAVATERLEREQRLRRLLSQRKVGNTVPLHDGKIAEPFSMRKGTLDPDDGVILSTFSNALLFQRLLSVLSSSDALARSQSFDEVLAVANPIFFRKLKAPLGEGSTEASQPQHFRPVVHSECAQLDRSGIVVHRRKRERHAHWVAAGEKKSAMGDSSGVRTMSTSSGLIQKSHAQWERYLTKELQEEGVSLQSFRQQRQDDSYLEKQRFLERSQWAEYQHELQVDARRRELKASRAIRRGESEMN
ncbi:hypothetical protein, conserved [Trypanosoma brucei gambiense DAL972]|uniref:BCNT-C domain-containing protein n=1 Tax=Trypanosoma brucei gambiense (strain MHOM/CI/86/DAL972) TaxID=679716 RepID=C9ZUH8_TRYB9|nr:hypothetical protein, conserved [Trypanosoma brucei gambiense DAL972]CBH13066.1 hypothetical protein, conserved [Trypanosoma brucei gambiense DAL972]|eukprot:XP_011775343.1 hypothetical protein, conserved [Trypanosoma brucei gambiense DAL972]